MLAIAIASKVKLMIFQFRSVGYLRLSASSVIVNSPPSKQRFYHWDSPILVITEIEDLNGYSSANASRNERVSALHHPTL